MTTQLVPVFTGTLANEPTQLVNARELHTFLESKQDFSTWIKNRIAQYDFAENQDYLLHNFMEQIPSGAKNKTDYHITLDMAKELSMVERNEKGKQARRYFIDCEKALHHHPLIALLTPSNPVMTPRELYDWRNQLREELNTYMEQSITRIRLVTTAQDYLDLLVTKDTQATALIAYSNKGGVA